MTIEILHKVKNGENYDSIAAQHGMSAKILKFFHHDAELKVGANLQIPDTIICYRCQKGDSLLTISEKFDVDLKDLRRSNGIEENKEASLNIDQELIIPVIKKATALAPQQRTPETENLLKYTIQSGDNLGKIAKNHDTTIEELQRINPNIPDPHLIKAGQIIQVPLSENSPLAQQAKKAARSIMPPIAAPTAAQEKVIYLTYDDGPHPKYTRAILDKLDEYGMKATFFVLGANAEKYPDLTREIHNRGHELAVHGWTHESAFKLSDEQLKAGIKKTQKLIHDITGVYPEFYRPPYGHINDRIADALSSLPRGGVIGVNDEAGAIPVGWDIDSKDSNPDPKIKGQIYETFTGAAKDKAIALFHDIQFVTATKTPAILDWMKDNGYTSQKLSEHPNVAGQEVATDASLSNIPGLTRAGNSRG